MGSADDTFGEGTHHFADIARGGVVLEKVGKTHSRSSFGTITGSKSKEGKIVAFSERYQSLDL